MGYGAGDYGYSEAGYGYGVRSFRGVFDGLTLTASFLGAWSFSRRLWSGVNVPLFRARRAVDSAERDWFGTGPQGEVNIVEFQSWCSGGNAFAVTLYDQSGLARNFTQATTTIQPILAESGTAITENGRLAAKFVAADARRMAIASSTAMFNALHTTGGTVLVACRANDTATVKALINNNNGTTSQAGINIIRTGTETLTVATSRLTSATAGNSITDASTATSITFDLLAITVDPDNATAANRLFGWANGTAIAGLVNAATGTPGVEDASQNMTLGAYANGNFAWDGTITDLTLADAIITTVDRDEWESRSGIFYGVTIS